MKKIALLISILISLSVYARLKPCPINIIELQKDDLISLISTIHQQPIYQYHDLEKSIFIINIKKHNDNYILEFSITYKQNIDYILENNQFPLYGYFKDYICPVFVFSNNENPFFHKISKIAKIPWVNIKKVQKSKKNKFPPPPIIYEPKIWIYEFKNNTFNLIGCRN